MRGCEVLPLQQHVGQFGSQGLNEPVDELVILRTADTAVAHAEIQGVREKVGVVGAAGTTRYMNSSSAAPGIGGGPQPRYRGSSRSSALSVPTSRRTGRVRA